MDYEVAGGTLRLTHLEMPGEQEGYLPLYDPGGPGPQPFDDVVYSAPSPPLSLEVTHALDDPMQVSRDCVAHGAERPTRADTEDGAGSTAATSHLHCRLSNCRLVGS